MTYKRDWTYGPDSNFKVWLAISDPLPWVLTDESVLIWITVTPLVYEAVLPAISPANKGRVIWITNTGTGAGTYPVTPAGADTIENSATYSIPTGAGNAVGLINDGISNWSVVVSSF